MRVIALLAHCFLSVVFGYSQNSNTGELKECDSKMTAKACDDKIRHDLAVAIHNNSSECRFEPDWRPSSVKEVTLYIAKLDGPVVGISIGGEQHTLVVADTDELACRDHWGKQCSHWLPKTGKSYPADLVTKSTYLNSCLNRVLPARRHVCIGFGKVKEEKLPYGVSRTSESTTCYDLPVTK